MPSPRELAEHALRHTPSLIPHVDEALGLKIAPSFTRVDVVYYIDGDHCTCPSLHKCKHLWLDELANPASPLDDSPPPTPARSARQLLRTE